MPSEEDPSEVFLFLRTLYMNPANSQEALAQLQQQQSLAQNPNQILEAQRQNLGVQGAQDTVTGLRGAINNTTKLLKQVAPSVMGRTGSSLVTNAQATRQIANEQRPISERLSEQGGEYNEANRSLAELQQRAQEAASGIYQGQQDKLSYAQNLYNTLYQREQEAERARIAELDRQEQIRQFNEQLALSRKAASGGGGFTLGGGGNVSSNGLPAGMTAKNVTGEGNSGYNFTVGGKPVSAATFASANNIPIGDLLYRMGSSGDAMAQQAYNWLKSIQDSELFRSGRYKQTPAYQRYSSLFWGS